jgi:hypothetical protein
VEIFSHGCSWPGVVADEGGGLAEDLFLPAGHLPARHLPARSPRQEDAPGVKSRINIVSTFGYFKYITSVK